MAFIREQRDRPFFAYVPFNAVHTPIEATPKYQDRFPEEADPTRRDYYAMTSALDDAVGAIVGALEECQLSGKTLVVFLNDNGGPLYTGVQSNGPLRLGKLYLFEGGVRVPMIVKWPGVISPGSVFDGVASSLDVFPTVCAAAGIDVPDSRTTGRSGLDSVLVGRGRRSPSRNTLLEQRPQRRGSPRQLEARQIARQCVVVRPVAGSSAKRSNLAETLPDKVEELEAARNSWKSEMAATGLAQQAESSQSAARRHDL